LTTNFTFPAAFAISSALVTVSGNYFPISTSTFDATNSYFTAISISAAQFRGKFSATQDYNIRFYAVGRWF